MAVRKRKWITTKGTKKECWEIDYINDLGKRVVKGGFRTKVEAENAIIKARSDIQTGNYIHKSNITLEEAINQHIELYAEIHCKESTCDGYKSYLRNHILPYFGKTKVIDITSIMIESFTKQKKDEGLSNQTINHLLHLIGAALGRMVRNKVIATNSVKAVNKMKLTNKEMKFLTIQEVNAVLDTAKKHYPDFYPLLFTAISTGMRRGELLALTWDKVNYVTGKISVDLSYSNKRLTAPKTKNSTRKIDMPKALMRVLKEWQLRCPHSDKNLVFPNNNGDYLDVRNMYTRRFEPVLRKAGIDKIRWHDLRHTFASILISQNVQPKYIQKQMGHSSITITMDRYGHIMPEVTQQGIEALDNLLENNSYTDININLKAK